MRDVEEEKKLGSPHQSSQSSHREVCELQNDLSCTSWRHIKSAAGAHIQQKPTGHLAPREVFLPPPPKRKRKSQPPSGDGAACTAVDEERQSQCLAPVGCRSQEMFENFTPLGFLTQGLHAGSLLCFQPTLKVFCCGYSCHAHIA